jgi:hypothetical protein
MADAVSSSEAETVESLDPERSLLPNLTSSGNSSESMSDKGDPDAGVSGGSSSMFARKIGENARCRVGDTLDNEVKGKIAIVRGSLQSKK